MRKTIILLVSAALLAVSCREAQDTRFFAPDVEFGEAAYTATAESGSLDVPLRLSRPAPAAFQVFLRYAGGLQHGLQFQASSNIEFAKGDTEKTLHVDLVDDEIWDESSWFDITIAPNDQYTVHPEGNCVARVNVTKSVINQTLHLVSPEGPVVTNPFLGETLTFEIRSERVPSSDIPVVLDLGGLAPGTDCLVDGGEGMTVTLPGGSDKVAFTLTILPKDESGLDRHETLSIIQQKGVYVVASDEGSVDIHLSDPVVDFSPLLSTGAANGGEGYVVRQAFLGADGAWSGNTTADMGVSSQGSNYLRTYRNMYDHPSFRCRANASVSQMFRLSDLFPNYIYPNATAILDYGNDQGHREFSPCDSLMRFVLDKGETKKGTIHLRNPKTFVAFIGSYAGWQEKIGGENAWIKDSRATGGDIFASTHSAITGKISVTLERLEGTFDFTNTSEPVVVTAWFSSDSDQFMAPDEPNGKTPATTYAASQEDGLWKLTYKIWPR